MEKDNKLIAEFMGMQESNLGWYDDKETLNGGVFSNDNTFDELKFHSSWDWLMPVIMEIGAILDKPMDEVMAHLTLISGDNIWDINSLYKSVITTIKELDART